MSRGAIAITLVVYAAVALVLGEIMGAMVPYNHAHPVAAVFGRAAGAMLSYFVMPGVVPLVIWAFFKFRAANALLPIVLWGIFGLVIFGLAALGTFYRV
jgi:hypothetical protein